MPGDRSRTAVVREEVAQGTGRAVRIAPAAARAAVSDSAGLIRIYSNSCMSLQ